MPVDDSGVVPLNLRSFGIAQQTAAPTEVCEEFADIVSQRVIASWLRAAAPAGSGVTTVDESNALSNENCLSSADDVSVGAHQLVRRLQLDSAGISGNARALVELQLGCDPLGFLQAWLDKQPVNQHSTDASMLCAMDALFCDSDADLDEGRFHLLEKSPAEVVEPLSEKLRTEIRRWITGRIDDPRDRLAGARRAVSWLNEHTERTESELQLTNQSVAVQLSEFRQELLRVVGNAPGVRIFAPGKKVASRVGKYLQLWLDQLTFAVGQQIVREIRSDAKTIADEITMLSRELERIAATVDRTMSNNEPSDGADSRLAARLRAGLPALVHAVDERLQADFIAQHGGLQQIVMQGGRLRAHLTAKLHEYSRQAVQELLAGVNVFEDRSADGVPRASSNMASSLAVATPSLLSLGGTRRVLAILPRAAAGTVNDAEISRTMGTATAVVSGDDNNLTICVEAAQLSLMHVALSLVQRRRDRVEFAERVHCRTDISWKPLVAASDSPTPLVWENADFQKSSHTQSRQDVCKTVVM